jgi:hypothetical protein
MKTQLERVGGARVTNENINPVDVSKSMQRSFKEHVRPTWTQWQKDALNKSSKK